MRKHSLAKCEECTLAPGKYIPTEGNPSSVVLVGESPQRMEERTGKHFMGSSGELLSQVLKHHGINREDCLLTTVVLCRLPDGRGPTKKEIACCAPRLESEIKESNPDVIVTLGNVASAAIMGKSVKITSFRAGPPKESPIYPSVKVIPTFHPANCLRSADSFPSLVNDIGKVVDGRLDSSFNEPSYAVY